MPFVNLADIPLVDPEWVIPNWVPRGQTSAISGDPNAGKTNLIIKFCTMVIDGGIMPDGSIIEAGGVVLYFDGENGIYSMRRRTDLHGLKNHPSFHLHTLEGVGTGFDHLNILKQLPVFRRMVDEIKPDWVIIDPLVAYHEEDEIKATSMRRLGVAMMSLAHHGNCGLTFVQHPSKDKNAKGMFRMRGSLDLSAAPRAQLEVVWADEENKIRQLVAHKVNDAISTPDPLTFTIIPKRGVTFMEELQPPDESLPSKRKTEMWLITTLQEGPLPSREIQERAITEGIAWKAIQRAAKALKVEVRNSGRGTPWMYHLPPHLLMPTTNTIYSNTDQPLGLLSESEAEPPESSQNPTTSEQ